MPLALLFHYLMLNMLRMLVHPSSGACDLLWIYFMGCVALVRCVLVLRCGSAGVVWYPYAGWGSASLFQLIYSIFFCLFMRLTISVSLGQIYNLFSDILIQSYFSPGKDRFSFLSVSIPCVFNCNYGSGGRVVNSFCNFYCPEVRFAVEIHLHIS